MSKLSARFAGFSEPEDRSAELRACVQHYRSESDCASWTEDAITPRVDRCLDDLADTACVVHVGGADVSSSFKTPSSCSDYLKD
ncbi:MAG: hypothetical protein RLZZ450_4113 [Pseudomonadota bacterium]|jgi:hypothetical protein